MSSKEKFLLPFDSLPLMLYQRSEYQSGARKILRNVARRVGLVKNFDAAYNRHLVKNVSERKRISALYFQDMDRTFEGFRDYLPSRADNILDIGCGMGGIDLFLYNHFGLGTNIFLLDSHKTDLDINIGFHQDANLFSFYNDFDLSRLYLSENGVLESSIHTVNIETDQFPIDRKFDVVVSLLSWGFHYPLETYLEAVKGTLSDNSSLIVDVRNSTDGFKILEKSFGKTPIVVREMQGYTTYCVRLSS